MESYVAIPKRGKCPLFCILKTVLFAVVTVFMLFLPLGDPNVSCNSASSKDNEYIVCYLCEGYFLAAKGAQKLLQAFDFLICVIMDLLYEAKLKFYEFLERTDKRDLCNSICCTMDDDLNSGDDKESRCPQCKYVKQKCARKPKSHWRYAQL